MILGFFLFLKETFSGNFCDRNFFFKFTAVHLFEKSDNVMDVGTCSATCNDFLQIKMSVLQLKQKVRVRLEQKKHTFQSTNIRLNLYNLPKTLHYFFFIILNHNPDILWFFLVFLVDHRKAPVSIKHTFLIELNVNICRAVLFLYLQGDHTWQYFRNNSS